LIGYQNTNQASRPSFGNPNAQPPTPTPTPTSAEFLSPTFQTPRASTSHFDSHTGWTPTFAEEYSVFNATPGRLTKTEGHYSEIATPRPSTASSHNDLLLATTDIDPADQIHFSASKNSPLPYANLSNQFPSFSHPSPSPHGTPSEDKKKVNTPRKPTRRLQEAFAGQTPTPPHSANRPARKLVPKPARPTMQSGEDSLPQQQGASAHPNTLSISSQNQSIYSYPMSAPVTAPGYMGGKNFWDPDTTMSGMSMDMDFMTANTGFFDPSVQDPFHNPINWNQNNGMAPSNLDMTSFSAHSPHPTGSNGAFAPKQTIPHTSQPERSTTLLQGVTTSAETSFSILASSGGVDPGLLFSSTKPILLSYLGQPLRHRP
jgi:hypothetical protein